jgi:predicted aspartyl protease
MGTFTIGCRIANHLNRAKSAVIPQLLVDTGFEYTWIPEKTFEKIGIEREKKDIEFVMANGTHITRSVGFAILFVEGTLTTDEVVFAEKGDLILLGARTLEGLNLAVDPRQKKLVGAGPLPVA